MHTLSSIAAAICLIPFTTASIAPLASNNPLGTTFSAIIPHQDATTPFGAFKIAAAPNGEGANIQISLFNLPLGRDLSYGIYTGSGVANGDCPEADDILNPYDGSTGSKCKQDHAACAVGNLSDKHGAAEVLGGGSGTGYFAANYVDDYLSLRPDDPAYVGHASLVVMDPDGACVAYAKLVNSLETESSLSSQSSSFYPAPSSTVPKPTATATVEPKLRGEHGNNGTHVSSGPGVAACITTSAILAGIAGLVAFLV